MPALLRSIPGDVQALTMVCFIRSEVLIDHMVLHSVQRPEVILTSSPQSSLIAGFSYSHTIHARKRYNNGTIVE